MRPGETPVPIPNTTVKTRAADGTALETAWESRWLPASLSGDIAQLGEHLPCKQGVESSNLSVSIGWERRAKSREHPSGKSPYLENRILKEDLENI